MCLTSNLGYPGWASIPATSAYTAFVMDPSSRCSSWKATSLSARSSPDTPLMPSSPTPQFQRRANSTSLPESTDAWPATSLPPPDCFGPVCACVTACVWISLRLPPVLSLEDSADAQAHISLQNSSFTFKCTAGIPIKLPAGPGMILIRAPRAKFQGNTF